jgi:hypothetical protein
MTVPTLVHAGHDSVMIAAAFVLVIGGAIFIAISFRARPTRSGPAANRTLTLAVEPVPSVGRSLTVIMAGLSAGAAIIHLVAAPSHYEEIGDLAAGFLIAAAFQGWWALACLGGPSPRVAVVGIAVNLAILLAWLYTRTVGLPIGEFAGSAEPVGFPDGASVVFELLLIGGLLARLRGIDSAASGQAAVRTIASIAVVPVVGLVIVLTSLATLAIASGLDHGASGHAVATDHRFVH